MPKDKITIARIETLHPVIRCASTRAIDKAEKGLHKNMALRLVQAHRTFDEQAALFALGRTVINPVGRSAKKPKGDIVTNATAGKSLHNYGVAEDFCLLIDKDGNGTYEEVSWSRILDMDKDGQLDWNEVVEAFKSEGFSWGGDWRTFKDYPHVEMNFGHDWRWFFEQHQKKNFIPGTKYIKL